MGNRRLRKRCRALIGTLDIPEPFDITEFCHRLERRRGRPIRLVPITAGRGVPCAMWVGTAFTDYIFHDRGISLLHQQHIILHEIGHILFRHQDASPFTQSLARLLMPDLDAELIESMLGRNRYDCQQELEAETFADLVLLTVKRSRRQDLNTDIASSSQAGQIISRIEKAFCVAVTICHK